MYDFFRGRVSAIDSSSHLILEVNGIGYRFRISEYTRQALPLDGSEVVLYAHLQVKEDDLQLYGFSDPAERVAFNLLISVQGVGPSVGMSILSTLSIDELRQALTQKDISAFKQVKGVGAKSAERITLELHDKVERIPGEQLTIVSKEHTPRTNAADNAQRALIALGFSQKQSAAAVAQVACDDDADAESLIRKALAVLR
jgi:Holliday junction DNA helicase RuvA